MQSLWLADVSKAVLCIGPHWAQDRRCGKEYRPYPHTSHSCAPSSGIEVPDGHTEQFAVPAFAANFPGLHAEQVELPAGEEEPAPHKAHTVIPASDA